MRRMLTALSTLITVTLITATGVAFAAEPQVRREVMVPREQRSERVVSKPFLVPVTAVGQMKVLLDLDSASLTDPDTDVWIQLWIHYHFDFVQDKEPPVAQSVRLWLKPSTGELFTRDSMNKSWHQVHVDKECTVSDVSRAADPRSCNGVWRFSAGARYVGGNHTKDGKPVTEPPGFVMHAGMAETLRGRQVRVQIIPPDDSPQKWSPEHTVFKKPLNAGAVIEIRE